MPRKTITCPTCGEKVTTKYARQKYCTLCAILRDMAWGMRERTCPDCGDKYWPIRNTHKYCSRCHFDRKPASEYPVCRLCGVNGKPPPGVTDVCLHCVQSTYDMRKRYADTVRLSVNKRRRERGLT